MKLPEVIPSIRLRQPTPFGNMHLHISVDPQTGREREVFAQLGKGGDLAFMPLFKKHERSIPFRELLRTINATHREGYEA